ncbi:unnamed protein product [Moneuplotes crassus]|uniref:Major facilitator superfamily (MFS) profile domain-containing protein n=1 Tax=Euplotes crassus TaxID=5936 RepID=A0AAD1U9E2_EUPCR|nr:unnamed protein product [Moneuplotes crassus]
MRKRAEIEAEITQDDIELIKCEEHNSDEELGDGDEDVNHQQRRVLGIEDMLEGSGGFGNIQIWTFSLCILVGCMSTTFIHTMPFLEKYPSLVCQHEDGKMYFCEKKDICSNGELIPGKKWGIDDHDDQTLTHNWITQMNLYCESNFNIGLLGSVYFVGFVLSGFILMLADVYGRKKLTIIGTFVTTICIYGLFYCTDITHAYIWLFLTGLSIFRLYSIYMLSMEITRKKSQIYISSIFLAGKGLISVMIPSFYFLLGGKNWRIPYSFAIIMAPLLCVLTFFIPESPRYYYERRMYPQLRNLIRKFAKTNGAKMDHNYDIDKEIEDIRLKSKGKSGEKSKFYYLKDRLIFWNLCVVIICFIAVSFDSYLIGFHIKYIKGNLYFLTIVSTVSDCTATMLAGLLQKLLNTKRTLLISYISAMICGLPLIISSDTKWLIPFCIFGAKFGLAVGFNMIYFINSEIFPTLFVSFAFTVGNIFSRSVTIFAPLVAEIPEPTPMKLFCFAALVASGATFLLSSQTKEENPAETRKKDESSKK